MEEWRDAKGYEGLYQVSNMGRVRSLDRYVTNSRNPEYKVLRKGKILSTIDHGNGYRYITFTVRQKRKNHYIHRLVAEAFVDNPRGLKEIDHINRDKTDNRAENLRWVTHEENLANADMCVQRTKYKPTNTGYKYIREKDGRYRVAIIRKNRNRIDKSFKTLEEAIAFRDSVEEVIL